MTPLTRYTNPERWCKAEDVDKLEVRLVEFEAEVDRLNKEILRLLKVMEIP